MFDQDSYLGPDLYATSQFSLQEYNVDSLLVNNKRESIDDSTKNGCIRVTEASNRQRYVEFERKTNNPQDRCILSEDSVCQKQNVVMSNTKNGIHDIKLFSPFSTSSRSECSTNYTFHSPLLKEKEIKNTLKGVNNGISPPQTRNSKIPVFTREELKILSKSLPHTKIKRILKFSGLFNNLIGSEVPALLAIACELFVRDLTDHAWSFTKLSKRRILQVQDIKLGSTKDLRIRNLLEKSELKKEFVFEDVTIKSNSTNSISPLYINASQNVKSECYGETVNNSNIYMDNVYTRQYNNVSINKSDSLQQHVSYANNATGDHYLCDTNEICVGSFFPN